MNNSNERQELLIQSPGDVFMPSDNLSPIGLRDKWRVVPYEAEERCGNLLSAAGDAVPDDITFDPQLTGWYRIHIGILRDSVLSIKLTSDPTFFAYASSPVSSGAGNRIEESLWRCADMTGESIMLSRKSIAYPYISTLAGIRFVPMTDDEVAEWKAENERSDTKRIYATDDMHNILFFMNLEKYEDWHSVVLKYLGSDVEWISMEELRSLASGNCPADTNLMAFARPGERHVQKQFGKFDYDKVLSDLTELGHRHGFKMSVSLRMGAWGLGYPNDQCYFDCDFVAEHPEWRCIDRNGDPINAMSYVYPEVQDYLVGVILNMARSGCDAVTLIAHRGIPYVLFEKPVADRFYELYGESPYNLPLDDKRLHALHSDIMYEFMKKVRLALDENFGEHKVQIHLRALYTIFDTDYIGLDCERLAHDGLIDAVISYPTRFYEKLDGDIWQDGGDYRIDLGKYTEYVVKKCRATNIHDMDMQVFDPPYTNYRGEVCGPESEKERIAQWMELEKKYGVKVYLEIMGRHYTNEVFRKRALELYENGAERIGLWDSYARSVRNAMWQTAGRLGHKDELEAMDTNEHYRIIQMRRLAGYDISRYEPSWGG